ncbi:hypothetical protein PT974_12303 [Cladobotryum mycophilum]|uniref:Protein kinase domain-containing protein n=1 Tax=Cladobotryum mycophilum TaxID=491253 RepID=A0ABR0S7L6_9HYPO
MEQFDFHPATASRTWSPLGPGIEQMVLNEDKATGRRTTLQRYEPGAQNARVETHTYIEEIYLVEGDLHDITLGQGWEKGAYAYRKPGMEHGPFRSEKAWGEDKSESKPPSITSLQDLTIIESWDTETKTAKYVTFYHITPEEEVFFGQSFKNKRDMSLEEFQAALEHIKDEELFPEVPANVELTIAPENWDNSTAFIKRPGLICYESVKGTNFITKSMMDETLIMEQISKNPHPHIVHYHGCHVRRGRITAIVIELLDKTLTQYVSTLEFEALDRPKFIAALESAVDHLHSMGLAHNDINPDNIMVKDGMPVLIDLGSCQPYGNRLQSLGSEGWYEELFFTSEKKHDTFSMNKLKEWIQNPTPIH